MPLLLLLEVLLVLLLDEALEPDELDAPELLELDEPPDELDELPALDELELLADELLEPLEDELELLLDELLEELVELLEPEELEMLLEPEESESSASLPLLLPQAINEVIRNPASNARAEIARESILVAAGFIFFRLLPDPVISIC